VGRTFRSDNCDKPGKGFQALNLQWLKPECSSVADVEAEATTHKDNSSNGFYRERSAKAFWLMRAATASMSGGSGRRPVEQLPPDSNPYAS
jgi:hypothetical protein